MDALPLLRFRSVSVLRPRGWLAYLFVYCSYPFTQASYDLALLRWMSKGDIL